MARVRLKGLNKVRTRLADGAVKEYWYHKPSKTRLPGRPGDPDFMAAYSAISEKKTRNLGTLKWLIERYQESSKFTSKAERTRKDYIKQIKKIEIKFGDLPVEALDDPRIRGDFLEWRDEMARTSQRQADYAMAVLSIILNWAVNSRKIGYNHAEKPEKLYSPDRADKIWLPEHVAAFEGVASPEMRLALIVALYTGQRQGDIRRLPWTAYDGEYLRFRQSKRGRRIELRCPEPLKQALDAAPKKATTILCTASGRSWAEVHFQHTWKKTADKAGIKGLTFHDIRGTAVTLLAEAGCTPSEIAAVVGWTVGTVNQMMDVYQSRTKALSDSAIVKLENARRTKVSKRSSK